jgi:site-specific DNA-cytosine methylase
MTETKTVLDLCGGTGSWSKPYAEAGYRVVLITLPDNDVRKFRDLVLYGGHDHPDFHPHGILAAPPCTMFSFARQRAKKPRNFDEGMEIVQACLQIIWKLKPVWWALENPVGYLRRFLGEPPLTFKPCDYGDPWTKRTDLWGYYKIPRRRPVEVVKPKGRVEGGTRDWSFAKNGRDGWTRQEVRAMTPPGFAKAFFEANK